MLTIGSLFSGIGAMDLGLGMAGLGPVLWQVESEPQCQAVLAKRWPSVRRYEDVCTCGKHNLGPVDLICGGPPCQDISAAGKGAGLAGARSGLWFEMLRIVSELRPRWVVTENVASGARRWVDPVLGGLGELGYESLPIPVEARHVGAPHRRARIIIVSHLVGQQLRIEPGRQRRKDRAHQAQLAELGPHAGWPSELSVVPQADGAPRWMVRALGNCVVPQCAQIAGEVIRMIEERDG